MNQETNQEIKISLETAVLLAQVTKNIRVNARIALKETEKCRNWRNIRHQIYSMSDAVDRVYKETKKRATREKSKRRQKLWLCQRRRRNLETIQDQPTIIFNRPTPVEDIQD